MWQRYNQTTHIFEKSDNNGVTWAPLPLNASVLNEGSLAPAVLGNVAYTDRINYFANAQVIGSNLYFVTTGVNPSLYLVDPAQPVNLKIWRVMNQTQQLKFYTQDDIESGHIVQASLDRSGNLFVRRMLQLVGTGNATPGLRASGATLDVVLGDQTNWAGIMAANFKSVQSGNTLVDLTTSSNISCGGNLHLTAGYVYPGRIDAGGGYQASWYLATHAAYGLFTNTGIYITGGIQSPVWIRAGDQFYELSRAQALGNWTDYTPTIPGGTVTAIYAARWQTVGKTLTVSLYLGIAIASINNFQITLPAGFTCAGYSCSPCNIPGGLVGMCQTVTGQTVMNIYANIDGTGAVGGGVYGITAHIPIS